MLTRTETIRIDLEDSLRQLPVRKYVQGDNAPETMRIYFRQGPVSALKGCEAKARCLIPDGRQVDVACKVNQGSGLITVTPGADCFASPGAIKFWVSVTDGKASRTILIWHGYVEAMQNG